MLGTFQSALQNAIFGTLVAQETSKLRNIDWLAVRFVFGMTTIDKPVEFESEGRIRIRAGNDAVTYNR